MVSASPILLVELKKLMDLLDKEGMASISKEEYEEINRLSRRCIPLLKKLIKPDGGSHE